MITKSAVAYTHFARLTVAGHRATCSPSPALPRTGSPVRWSTSQRHTLPSVCVRLLRPSLLGTTRTPSPWVSRPVGDPMFRSGGTYERDVGAPLMPFNAFARHRPSRKAYHRRNSIPWLAMASDSRRATDECELPPLDIGVRAMQLSPYRAGVAGPYHTRLLLRPAFRPCSCPLALSGLGEVVASKSSALNFGLLWRQFLPCVTWRTLSPHPALQIGRWYYDATYPLPFGTTVASRAKLLSMPPVVTGTVLSSHLLLLAVLHHVQAITAWH